MDAACGFTAPIQTEEREGKTVDSEVQVGRRGRGTEPERIPSRW
jgi:hypothetical protein